MKITKRNIMVMICSLICIVGITFSAKLLKHIDISWLRIAAKVGINLLNGAVACIAAKLVGIKIDIDFANKRQYLIGIAIALSLSTMIAVIPALCGVSLVGNHVDFSWFVMIHDFLFFLLIIGPVEELVFRIYLQSAVVSLFRNHKWIGVVIASFLFGLFHLINGSFIQVVFTFGIGLVFGFAKYKIKDCKYLGLSLAHGLYDFLNTLVTFFVV